MSNESAPHTLRLPPSLSIRNAHAVREQLLSGLSDNNSVIIDIPEGADADLSFIQVVEASRRHAQTYGKSIALKNPAGGRVLETLRRGGFLSDMDAAACQFWFHRKEIQ